MTILSDASIAAREDMISPFVPTKTKFVHEHFDAPPSAGSYGLGSCGYDARIGRQFRVMSQVRHRVLGIDGIGDKQAYEHVMADHYDIPPGGMVLAMTVERFKIPRDVCMLAFGKSTLRRYGIVCDVTPGEPGWEGHLTLEFTNTAPLPVRLWAGSGGVQLQFHKLDQACYRDYAELGGKYQGQTDVTLPR